MHDVKLRRTQPHSLHFLFAQAKQLESEQDAHRAQLALKDELISAKKKEANKWQVMSMAASGTDFETVSYTHLTLPTNREV